jgi:hypothetical protein
MTNLYTAFFRIIYFVILYCFLSAFAIAQPAISSIAPASGPVGTSVTITGTGFIASQFGNVVNFGAIRAAVTTATATSITVTVPAGAALCNISVSNNFYTAYSMQAFLVTFPGGAGPFNPNSFAAKLDLATTANPYSIATGDLDGDGKPDLVVVNTAANTISVFLNTSTPGKISFAPKVDFPTGNSPHRAYVADVNGDGIPDIVVTNYADNTVSVFNNGSDLGKVLLSSKMDFPAGTSPESIVVGDVDGDGETDLVISTASGITILSNSSGTNTIMTFTDITKLSYGGTPAGIALGDIDGDGKPDIVASNSASNNITVLRNQSSPGNFSFGAPSNFFSWDGTLSISIADIDGDGKPDIVSGGNETIAISRNLSTPGNISFASSEAFPNSTNIYVAVADLDGDGRADIAGAVQLSNDVLVSRNLSSPGSLLFDLSSYYGTGNSPTGIAIADFDGDGKPDIAVSNLSSTTVSILRNRTNEPSVSSITSIGSCPTSGSQVQINGYKFTGTTAVTVGGDSVSFEGVSDSVLIIFAKGPVTGIISVTNAYGTGTFTVPAPVISAFSPSAASPGMTVTITGRYLCTATVVSLGGIPVSAYTINSDSSISAIVGTGASGSLSITSTNGTSSLPGFTYIPVPVITSFSPKSGPAGSIVTIKGKYFSSIAANDIVYFGAVKASVTAASDTVLLVSVPTGASYQPISLNNLENNLSAFSTLPFITTFGTGASLDSSSFSIKVNAAVTDQLPTWSNIIDMDGDGLPDLGIANFVSSTATAIRNTSISGDISFAAKISYSVGPLNAETKSINSVDFDGDGKPDLAIINTMDTNISILRNMGSPGQVSFGPIFLLETGYESGPTSLATGDFDGDGKTDIAVLNSAGGRIAVFRNTSIPGTLSFAPPIYLGAFAQVNFNGIAVADFNGDGKPEICALDAANTVVYIYQNQSLPGILSFAAQINYPTTANSNSIVTGDIDGDGLPDIIYSDLGSGTFSVMRNQSSGSNISFGPSVVTNLPSGSSTLQTYNLAIGDLDGDGKPDVSISTGTGVLVSKNISSAGNISFSPAIGFSMPYGYNTNHIAVGDLNSDGKPDLAVISENSSNVTIFLNTIDSALSPVIISFAPLIAGDGDTIKIKGTHFTATSAVSFGGTPSTSFQVASDSVIIAILGLGSSGTISVTNNSGTGTSPGFLYAGPDIISFSPPSATTGDTIVISGRNFTAADSVGFGGSPAASFTVASDSIIYAVIGVGASGEVVVQTPSGKDSLSGFVYIPPISYPTITSFSPDSGALGTTIIISGQHFAGTTAVYFGGMAAASFKLITDSSITAVVDSGRTGAVLVINAGGSDSLSGFTYISAPQPPVINSFKPDSAQTGQTITIKGQHFLGTFSVSFGNVSAYSFQVQSDSVITAVLATGATGAVTVATSSGIDTLGGFVFIATPSLPKIISITPDSASQGQSVLISGSNFTGTSSISFGGIPAASFLVLTDSSIRAVLGTGASGYVSVVTPTGMDSLAGFVYLTLPLPPYIQAFSPDTAMSGQTVNIHGLHFNGTDVVSFGLVPANSFTVVSDSLILATIGSGESGSVYVRTSAGADSLSGFVFLPDTTGPVISSFSPHSGNTGTVVSIFGAHFTGATSVSFGGTAASSFTVVSDSVINAVIGEGTSGAVTIATPAGSASLAGFVFTKGLTAYPNPAHGYVTVNFPVSATTSQISLSDMSGRIVFILGIQPNAGSATLNLYGLSPGIYVLSWSNGTSTLRTTISVQ